MLKIYSTLPSPAYFGVSPYRLFGAAALLSLAAAGHAQTVQFASPVESPFGLNLRSGSTVADTFPGALSFADLDGDGDLDVLAVRYVGFDAEGPEVVDFAYQENVGTPESPAFGPRTINPFNLNPNTNRDFTSGPSVFLGDGDGDGDIDLFLAESFEGESFGDTTVARLYFYENNGTPSEPSFLLSVDASFGSDRTRDLSIEGLTFADLDADGDVDLLSTQSNISEDENAYEYFENVPTESAFITFKDGVSDPFNLSASKLDLRSEFVSFGDLDGDGLLDLLSYNPNLDFGDDDAAPEYRSFFNTGTATAPAFGAPSAESYGLAESFAGRFLIVPNLVDIDADGDADLFVYTTKENEDEDDIPATLFFANGETTSATSRRVVALGAYPNPASSAVRLGLDRPVASLALLDALGRQVGAWSDLGAGASVDVVDLRPGIYLLDATLSDGTKATTRFVKE